MQPKDGKSPGPRGGEGIDNRQRGLEQGSRPSTQVFAASAADDRAEGPECPAVAVLGSLLFEPAPVKAHEVPEASVRVVERVLQERGVARTKSTHLGRSFVQFLQQNRE